MSGGYGTAAASILRQQRHWRRLPRSSAVRTGVRDPRRRYMTADILSPGDHGSGAAPTREIRRPRGRPGTTPATVERVVLSRRQEVGPRAKGDGARQQPQAGRDGGGVRRLRGTVTAPAAADGRGLHGVRCEAGSRLLAAAASMCERRWSAFGRLRGAVLDATEAAAQRRPGQREVAGLQRLVRGLEARTCEAMRRCDRRRGGREKGIPRISDFSEF